MPDKKSPSSTPNKFPKPLEIAVGLISAVIPSFAVGAFSYANARKDHREQIDRGMQGAYQRQIDEGATVFDKERVKKDSQWKPITDNYVKNAKRQWATSGAISGSIVGGIVSGIALSLMAAGLATPIGAAIGLGVAAVGALIGGVSSYLIGGNSAKSGAEDYVRNALDNPENQKGINREAIAKEQEKARKDTLNVLSKMPARRGSGKSGSSISSVSSANRADLTPSTQSSVASSHSR